MSFIEKPEALKQILQHPGLWKTQTSNSQPLEYCAAEQFHSYDCTDPDYLFEASVEKKING